MLDGGSGLNTLRYDTSGAAVAVDLSTGAVSGGDAEGDTISNFATLYGSRDFNDMPDRHHRCERALRPRRQRHPARAAGNDVLFGGAGADILDGGAASTPLRYDCSIRRPLDQSCHEHGLRRGRTRRQHLQFRERLRLQGLMPIRSSAIPPETFSVRLGGIDTISGRRRQRHHVRRHRRRHYRRRRGFDTLRYDASCGAVSVNLTSNAVTGGEATGDTISGLEASSAPPSRQSLRADAGQSAPRARLATILSGGGGNDYLAGGAGSDVFDFDTPLTSALRHDVDRITDFYAADDTFRLEGSIFTAFKAGGALAASAFWAGTAAHDSDDRIIYDKTSGSALLRCRRLGRSSSGEIRDPANKPAITAADFEIV